MSSVSEILRAFSPVIDGVRSRERANQTTPLDLRIANLVEIIYNSENGDGGSTFDDFEVVNTHLSHLLTLSNLKTSLECSAEATRLIVTYLRLQQNFDKINVAFPLVERIQAVSERVLKHISLFDMQLTGFVVNLEHSPVWYALAPDDQFLNRQIRDLKEFRLHTNVASSRIRDIEEQNPALLNRLQDVSFTKPWIFGTLDLTIGKLRLLSGNELNGIASKLPSSACGLFSDDQIRSVNFNLFSGEKMDEMIAGDGTEEDISRRLGLLNPDQIEVFLKKSSGCYFTKFSDRFYQMLAFSRLDKEQIRALFGDHYGRQKEKEVMHHLQLVSPQEISKGFHLLSGDLARMLSDLQVSFLDYSNMTSEQIDDLFESYHFRDKEEHRRRIQLISERFINDVTRTNSYLVEFLSPSQYQALNTALLDLKTVQKLFPGFAIHSIHPGYAHTSEQRRDEVRHKFELNSTNSSSMSSYSQKELDALIKKRRTHCMAMAQNFLPEQLRTMMPLMYLEVQELLAKKTNNLFNICR